VLAQQSGYRPERSRIVIDNKNTFPILQVRSLPDLIRRNSREGPLDLHSIKFDVASKWGIDTYQRLRRARMRAVRKQGRALKFTSRFISTRAGVFGCPESFRSTTYFVRSISVAQRRITMAEINKLSVGKVLDKLRRNDAPQKSMIEQLDAKAEKIDEEIQRLRAATRRLKSGPRTGTTGRK